MKTKHIIKSVKTRKQVIIEKEFISQIPIKTFVTRVKKEYMETVEVGDDEL